LATE
jgi:VIT1/CCC1 family predicted Fe2+/Mn2+ transporter